MVNVLPITELFDMKLWNYLSFFKLIMLFFSTLLKGQKMSIKTFIQTEKIQQKKTMREATVQTEWVGLDLLSLKFHIIVLF